jgi:hypothetical protein
VESGRRNGIEGMAKTYKVGTCGVNQEIKCLNKINRPLRKMAETVDEFSSWLDGIRIRAQVYPDRVVALFLL